MEPTSTHKDELDDSPLKKFSPDELKVLGKFVVLTGGASAVSTLPNKEQDLLLNAVKQLESIAFERILAKLKKYAITAAVVLTGFGLLTLTNLKSTVTDAAVAKLVADSELRQRVHEDVAQRVDQAEKISQTSRELSLLLEREAARSSEAVSTELRDLSKMLKSINKRMAEVSAKAEKAESTNEGGKNETK